MAQLVATAMAMVNAPADRVHEALLDYREVRPLLLTPEFGGYQVQTGGHGVGTQVRWTLALDEAVRARKGRGPRTRRQAPWECVIRVDEVDERRIVERDTRSGLVVTWTLRAADESRTAVLVRAAWAAPNGLIAVLRRAHQRLAVRLVYEGVVTRLHELFEAGGARRPVAADDPSPISDERETGPAH